MARFGRSSGLHRNPTDTPARREQRVVRRIPVRHLDTALLRGYRTVRRPGMVSAADSITASDQVVAGFVDKSGGRFTLEEIRREVARRHSDEEDEAPTDESLRRDEYRALVEGMPPRRT